MDKPLHFAVRFSDNLFSVGNVVERHNELVKHLGYVWFGKMGMPISQNRIDMVNQQIQNNIPTNLFLVQGNRKKSNYFKANLLSVARELPKSDKGSFPKYYNENKIIKHIQTWFKITEIYPIDSSEINNLKAISSINPLGETLVRSSTGYFMVQERNSTY